MNVLSDIISYYDDINAMYLWSVWIYDLVAVKM